MRFLGHYSATASPRTRAPEKYSPIQFSIFPSSDFFKNEKKRIAVARW